MRTCSGIPSEPEPTQPGVCVEDAHLLLGDWTWEPASSRLVDEFQEGPLGSVDLSLQVLHEPPTAWRGAARRGPAGAAGVAGHFQPPLWKRLMSLLQPPTDLLLDTDGPIEWPAALFQYQVDAVQTLLAREAIL